MQQQHREVVEHGKIQQQSQHSLKQSVTKTNIHMLLKVYKSRKKQKNTGHEQLIVLSCSKYASTKLGQPGGLTLQSQILRK